MRFSVLALSLVWSAITALDTQALGRRGRKNDCCQPTSGCDQHAAPSGGCCGPTQRVAYAQPSCCGTGYAVGTYAGGPMVMPGTGIVQTGGYGTTYPITPAGGVPQPMQTTP